MKRTKHFLKWNDDRTRLVKSLALLGATDEQMAVAMNININTLDMWKRVHPEFMAAMRAGKLVADSEIAKSFFKRAKGFWAKAVDIKMFRGQIIKTKYWKYYPPDPWSCARILSTRQRPIWADVTKIETTQTNININKVDFTGLSTDELLLMKQIQEKQKRLALDPHNGTSQN